MEVEMEEEWNGSGDGSVNSDGRFDEEEEGDNPAND